MSHSPSSREIDLSIAASIDDCIRSRTNARFILTGSYSIDLLTNAEVKHNDVDANIFTKDIGATLGQVGLLLESTHHELLPILRTDTRLEYMYEHTQGSTEVELQFVKYTDAHARSDGYEFTLPPDDRSIASTVPTIYKKTAWQDKTDTETHAFLVKSLPFAIATWALRISGVAANQKREVRQTDIDHFALLIGTPHDAEHVLDAIEHHPQMPNSTDAKYVFNTALTFLDRGTK